MTIILFLVLAAGLRLDAAFNITGVEYLRGDDFVQLHFPTDKLIPIPDLFYPDESDPTHIVMRVSEVEFKAGRDSYTFDSPVVELVAVRKNDKYVDIDIKLKDRVNYRVFTNQKGLYVEFPIFQNTASRSGVKPADKVLAQNKPVSSTSPSGATSASPSGKTNPAPVTPAVKTVAAPPAQTAKSISASIAPAKPGKGVTIENFQLVEQDTDHVLFMCTLSGPAEYVVLPIPDAPTRLAVDFKNTRARSMNQTVDVLNVKKVRGALNSDNVYRLVFDLHYLKNYNVSLVDNNKLFVEFFNSASSSKKPSGEAVAKGGASGSQPATPLIAENNPALTPLNDTPSADSTANSRPAPAVDKKNDSGSAKVSPAETGAKEIRFSRNSGSSSEGEIWMNGKLIDPKKDKLEIVNPDSVRKEVSPDFFSDEKAQASSENLQKEEKGKMTESEAEKEEQLGYLRRTIKEGKRKYTGDPIDFSFKGAELENVLLFFAKLTGLSIVIDPGVKGTVTARMYKVPWDQALEYFLKVNGLDAVLEGNLLRVGKVQDLMMEAENRSKLQEKKEMQGELTTKIRPLSFATAGDLVGLLKSQLSPRGGIMVDGRSNTLIITDLPERFDVIDQLIDALDTANPQVSIEARIVESNANYTRNLGIQWGFSGVADAMYGNQTSLRFPNSVLVDGSQIISKQSPLVGPLQGYAVNLPAAGATTGVTFSIANAANTFRLDMALSAMQSEGQGRIISSPKTTTHNNRPAKVMQGKQIPVQTIQNNTVTTQYIPAALELNVTPQITARGTIIVIVDIKNNSPDFGNLVQGIPPITTQTLNTTVMVEDGGTIVIGGIYRVEDATTKESTPFLSKLPILGNLFRNSSRRSEQKELLIFLTPRIIK